MPLIVHVVYRFDIGGLENGLVNLINRLPGRSYRHAIVCLTNATEFRRRLVRNVPIIELHKHDGNDLRIYLRLWRVFHQLKPDIVHTRNLAALEAQVPAFVAGVPCRVHGEHGRDVGDLDGSNKRYRIIRLLVRPFVHRYIPLSRELTCYLQKQIRVPDWRIVPICNGVDLEIFHPAPRGGQEEARLAGAGLLGPAAYRRDLRRRVLS